MPGVCVNSFGSLLGVLVPEDLANFLICSFLLDAFTNLGPTYQRDKVFEMRDSYSKGRDILRLEFRY